MIKDKIIEMVKEELLTDEIDINADLTNDYQIDSIGLIEFVMSLEDEFNIEIADEELQELRSTKDVIDLVESKVK
ncbi:acyl carrier protein [Helcococcus massiliensis]|uniref:acyl carrier protein n=1 Tax=Helcococcus massiliensis TaxID=2040290 RepID=UPI000CDF01DA|nr:phosphopantetheine-binding protein [Helcococcus massiliensis]